MNNSNQSTILVKKADGASVRMTMEELRAYKKSQTASAPAPVSVPPASQLPETQNMKPETFVKAEPLKPARLSAPIQQSPSSPARHASLQGVAGRQSLVPPSASLREALRAGKTYTRPAPPKEEKMFEEKWEKDDNKSLLDESPVKVNLPMVKPMTAPLPATTAPVKNIFVDEAKYKSMKHETRNMKHEMPKISEAKPLIQDVLPPQTAKQSIGPIDELANFSLVDFRRLEINSKAAGLKLLEKFNNLKEDSYLLFMEAVKAWYNSPLYRQYQEVLYQSFARGKSVNEILLGGDIKKDLKSDEFKAILSVNEAVN